MKTYALILITILCFTAHAEVLTFDDLTIFPYIAPIPEGYGGFTWDMIGAVYAYVYPGSGYENGLVSGEYVGFNVLGEMALINGATFDFNGVYLTAAWREGLNITVSGYLGEDLLYQRTVVVDLYEPTWFDFNYAGIDALVFDSYGGVDVLGNPHIGPHFVMENFTYNEPIVPLVMPVNIDINPGTCPNKVNVKSSGLLSVAIAGSEDLLAYDIDGTSLEILGVRPVKSIYEDVTSPTETEDCECAISGPDGYVDLVLKFDRQAVIDAIGEVEDGDYVLLTLMGYLQDDTPIEGSDCILIMKKGKP